ncbi:MAG: hypothetical protein K2M50_05940 [Treponemataceae bacterium]|nr:hypothetical protein [Treponemataceae bacterium]
MKLQAPKRCLPKPELAEKIYSVEDYEAAFIKHLNCNSPIISTRAV